MNGPDHDEVLRRVLAGAAEQVDPEADWDDVRRRARGIRRPPGWLSAAAVLVVGAVLGLVLLTRGGEDEAGVVADDPAVTAITGSTTTSTTAPTTTVPASTSVVARVEQGPDVEPLDLPAGAPLRDDELVVSIIVPNGGDPDLVEVAVVSKANGAVLRTLAAGFDASEGGVYDLALTRDRRTVLYTVSTSGCSARIDAVAVDGSSDAVRVFEEGDQVTVSPDGSMIAVAPGDTCAAPPSVDVVPVAGGRSTRYVGLGPVEEGIESMAFADDDTLLYVMIERTTEPARWLRRLDLRSGAPAQLDLGAGGASYTSLSRHRTAVTALERSAAGAPALVTIEDGAITDRREVQLAEDPGGTRVGYDHTGAIVAARWGDQQLMVDGRVLRDDVLDVAL